MRWVVSVIVTLACAAQARAHGALPSCNSIAFGPDAGLLLGTNFGAILQRDGAQRFVCEMLVTGAQRALDRWLWLDSGAIVGAVTEGGFPRGVFASDPSACGFATVAGTEDALVTALVADPADAVGFFAMGQDDTRGMLLHGKVGEPVEVVHARDGAEPTGVRAAAGVVIAAFRAGTIDATLVYVDSEGAQEWPHTLEGGQRLRPLGIDPAKPDSVWLVRYGYTSQTLVRSDDRGRTLTELLTLDSPIEGFAIAGDTIWIQGPRAGVLRSVDRGATFEALAGSPHGSYLAFGPDQRLYACATSWQDRMVLGASSDGATFTTVIADFDHITSALECPAAPEATTLCDGELQFLRSYYGFDDPSVVVEPPAAEVTEPAPEVIAEPATGSDGCALACAPIGAALLMLFAFARFASLRAGR